MNEWNAVLARCNDYSAYRSSGFFCRRTYSLELTAWWCVIQLWTLYNFGGTWRRTCSPDIWSVSALGVFYVIALYKSTFTYLLTYLLQCLCARHYITLITELNLAWYLVCNHDGRRLLESWINWFNSINKLIGGGINTLLRDTKPADWYPDESPKELKVLSYTLLKIQNDAMHKISGKQSGNKVHPLRVNSDDVSDVPGIAHVLGQTFSANSSSQQYNANFQSFRSQAERRPF